jgi:hypothetical protein
MSIPDKFSAAIAWLTTAPTTAQKTPPDDRKSASPATGSAGQSRATDYMPIDAMEEAEPNTWAANKGKEAVAGMAWKAKEVVVQMRSLAIEMLDGSSPQLDAAIKTLQTAQLKLTSNPPGTFSKEEVDGLRQAIKLVLGDAAEAFPQEKAQISQLCQDCLKDLQSWETLDQIQFKLKSPQLQALLNRSGLAPVSTFAERLLKHKTDNSFATKMKMIGSSTAKEVVDKIQAAAYASAQPEIVEAIVFLENLKTSSTTPKPSQALSSTAAPPTKDSAPLRIALEKISKNPEFLFDYETSATPEEQRALESRKVRVLDLCATLLAPLSSGSSRLVKYDPTLMDPILEEFRKHKTAKESTLKIAKVVKKEIEKAKATAQAAGTGALEGFKKEATQFAHALAQSTVHHALHQTPTAVMQETAVLLPKLCRFVEQNPRNAPDLTADERTKLREHLKVIRDNPGLHLHYTDLAKPGKSLQAGAQADQIRNAVGLLERELGAARPNTAEQSQLIRFIMPTLEESIIIRTRDDQTVLSKPAADAGAAAAAAATATLHGAVSGMASSFGVDLPPLPATHGAMPTAAPGSYGSSRGGSAGAATADIRGMTSQLQPVGGYGLMPTHSATSTGGSAGAPAAAPRNKMLADILETCSNTISHFLSIKASGLALAMLGVAEKALRSSQVMMREGGRQDGAVLPQFNESDRWTTGILAKMEAVHKAGSEQGISAIVAAIKTTLADASQKQLYIGSLAVPGTGSPESHVDKDYDTNGSWFSQMQSLSGKRAENGQKIDYKVEIERARKAFNENSTRFACFKVVEGRFGLPVNDALYYKLMENARNAPESANAILEDGFFEEIDKSGLPWWTRQQAKAFYYILKGKWGISGYMEGFIDQASKYVVERAEQHIADNKKDGFSAFGSTVVEKIQNYFAILRGAFESVTTTKAVGGSLDKMMEAQLGVGVPGQKLNRDELYNKLTELAFNKFVPTLWEPQEWVSKITVGFGNLVKSLSSNTTFHWVYDTFFGNLFWSISWIYKIAWYLPLGIPVGIVHVTNWLARKALSSVVDGPTVVNSVLTNGIKAFTHNGYAHALNQIAIEQGAKIWESLRASSEGTAKPPTQAQKEQFQALVKEALPVMELSKFDTTSEAATYLHRPSLLQSAQKSLNEMFVEKTVKNAVGICAIAWESTFKEEILQAHLLTMMDSVNNSFAEGRPVSEERYKATELALQEIRERIINFAIDQALKDELNFSLPNQHALAQKHLGRVKENAAKLSATPVVLELGNRAEKKPAHFKQLNEAFLEFIKTNMSLESHIKAEQGLQQDAKSQLETQMRQGQSVAKGVTSACVAIRNIHDRQQLRKEVQALIEKLHVHRLDMLAQLPPNAVKPGNNPQIFCENILHAIHKELNSLADRGLFENENLLRSLSDLRSGLDVASPDQAKKIEEVLHQVVAQLNAIIDNKLVARADDEQVVKGHLASIQQGIVAIDRWNQSLTFVAPVELPIDNKWIKQQLTTFVRSQVNERLEGVDKFWKKPYNYRGMIDNIVFETMVAQSNT